MEVSFSLEPDDLIAVHVDSVGRIDRYFQIGCSLIFVGAALGFVIYWLGEGSIGAEVALLIVLVMSYMWFSVSSWRTRRQERRQIESSFLADRDRLVSQQIKLTPEELIHSTAVDASATRWEAIRKIRETSTHIFIFTSDTSAIVVPRRAFTDERAFRNFAEEARSYHARAVASK